MARQETDRLDSWKEIAAHLGRSVRTVRRWERHEGMPVHRQMHRSRATVYAYGSEIDAWRRANEERLGTSHSPAVRETSSVEPSIAVLPFDYVGPDAEGGYLADGFTEEVIAHLSRLRALRVISRTSAMTFKGTGKDARKIGRELGVHHLLEGTVRQDGPRLRVSARLIAASRDDRLWAQTYEGTIEDVFSIQEEIARRIAGALTLRLTPEEDRRLSERRFDDVPAWKCVLLARQEAFRWRPDSIDYAIRLLQNGLYVVGPNAELYAALGHAHLQYREAGIDLGDGPIEEAERWAGKASAIDASSAAVRRLHGWIHYSRGEIQSAVRDLGDSLESDPNDPDTLGVLSNCYLISGRVSAARPLIARLLAIDPLTPLNRCLPGWADALEGNLAAAVVPYRQMFEMDLGNPLARLFYTWILAANTLDDEAARIASSFPESQEGSLPALIAKRFVEKPSGGWESAFGNLTREDEKIVAATEMFPRLLAQASARAGRADEAVRWLDLAVERGFVNYPFLATHDPFFRRLDDHPAFLETLRTVKLRWESFEVHPMPGRFSR